MKKSPLKNISPHGAVSSLYTNSKPVFSLEFFPPKTDEGLETTKALIKDLSNFEIDYMTVTYGAGGGTRSNTHRLVSFIRGELQVCAVAHLTCVNHTVQEIDGVVDELVAEGIKNILALRGDLPSGRGTLVPQSDGFSCARDLVQHLKKRGDVSLLAAGYPEGHTEAVDCDSEMAYLKAKVDSGAEVILTQLFFDENLYFRFVEKARSCGIAVPIVPGVMPIRDVTQLEKIHLIVRRINTGKVESFP